mgnify:CR=1 FL=1
MPHLVRIEPGKRADLCVVEGVMGLYDGSSPTSLEGSTGEIARLLAAPVVLVAGALVSVALFSKSFLQARWESRGRSGRMRTWV